MSERAVERRRRLHGARPLISPATRPLSHNAATSLTPLACSVSYRAAVTHSGLPGSLRAVAPRSAFSSPLSSARFGGFMQGLTHRQQMVLEYIRRSITDRGYPPTLREIGAFMGIRSTN